MDVPFLVIEVIENKLGAVKEAPSFNKAIDVATKFAMEQTTLPEKVIREELERDNDWCDETGNIWVYVTTADIID